MSTKLADLNVRIGASLKGLDRGLGRARKKMRNFAKQTGAIANTINKVFTRAFVAVGLAGSKLFLDVGKNFTKIENLVGVTGKVLDGFKKGIRSISNTVGISQAKLSDALFTVTSAGLRGAEALKVLMASAKGSVVGLGSVKEIARATTAVLQAYGKENITASQAANVLFNTIKEGNLEASDLAPQLGKVIGVGAKMKVTFAEIGANIATFTRLGVDSATAVTGLTATLTNFLKPTEQTRKLLASVGLTAEDVRKSIAEDGLAKTLATLMQHFDGNMDAIGQLIPNVRALRSVLGVTGSQTEEYQRIVQALSTDTEGLSKAFAKASESDGVKLQKAMVKLQNAAIKLGAIIVPVVVRIADKIGMWATRFEQLDKATQNSIVKTAAWISGIGIGLKIISSGVTTLSTMVGVVKSLAKSKILLTGVTAALNAVMNANPVLLIVTGIGLLITALVTAYKKSAKFRAVLAGLGAFAKELFGVIKEAVGSFVDGWNEIKDGNITAGLKKFGEGLVKSNPLSIAITQGKRLGDSFTQAYRKSLAGDAIDQANQQIADSFGGVGSTVSVPTVVTPTIVPGDTGSVTSMLQDKLSEIVEGEGEVIEVKPKIAISILDKIPGKLEVISSTYKGLKDVAVSAMDKLKEKHESWLEKVKASNTVFLDLKDMINGTLSEVVSGVASAFGSILSGASNVSGIGQAILLPILNMMEQLGKLAIASGIAIKGIRAAFKSLNPVVAIAGGAALIALSRFIKGKISSSVPKLARGGLAIGEQLVTVGDNQSGREAIIPFERMGEFMNMMPGKQGDSDPQKFIFEFAGGALRTQLEQDNYFTNRTR